MDSFGCPYKFVFQIDWMIEGMNYVAAEGDQAFLVVAFGVLYIIYSIFLNTVCVYIHYTLN